MNYVGENDIKLMADDDAVKKNFLNPVVVMNVRHEMVSFWLGVRCKASKPNPTDSDLL